MTVETKKQKRIIHFVITTTIDHYLSIYCWNMTVVETQKQKRIIHFDHYNHWPLSVETWLLKKKQKRIIHFVITTTIDHYLSI